MARNKFDVDEELDTPFQWEHFKRMLHYIRPYRKQIMLAVLLMLVASGANLIGPYLMKQAIDREIPNGHVKGLALLAGIYFIAIVVTALCMRFRIRIMSELGQNVIYNIRKDLFSRLQELSFSYYDSRPHGKILVRVVNYVNSLSDLLSNGIINLIADLFSLFVIVGFMLAIDVKLTLYAMAGFPILAAVVFFIKNAQRKSWQQLSNKQSNMNAYIHESLNGIKVTQAFVREEENMRIFLDVSNSYRSSWMKAVSIQFLLWPAIENISVLTVSFVYIMGIHSMGQGEVTLGALVAFVGYIWMFWAPLTNIGNFYNAIINAMAYLERIFEMMDERPEVTDVPNAANLPPIRGDVAFEDVVFGYEENIILDRTNFRVNAGDTIALVGATGSGKTTIVNLISRFYDIKGGAVKIDGTDISKVKLASLRRQMGVMLQDPFIFSGTIMDNIRYGRLNATNKEVIAAAKAVQAHEFIIALKDGYHTEVNERGTRLFAGQRQLISFARALLADPRILILDEATSSIDTETELALQKGLEKLLKGRTSFIIAHRLSTIQNATCILCIEAGRIVEEGTHEQLMKNKGHYWKLHQSQHMSFIDVS